MAFPQVVAVAPGSPADRAGLAPGDEIVAMNGSAPRDIIEYQLLADDDRLVLSMRRGGLEREVELDKDPGEPLGLEISSPVFDRVRTCDNHCSFCFIYQLPKHMRRSLYLKDDDYRLSFLYGNFTTLTRFTELDLERVVTERLSPLYVSIHATDPEIRARLLRNRRGAMSLRWLRALLDHGIEVHGQVVVCPGVNDGAVLEDTLLGLLERFSEITSAAVVPLGVSRFSDEAELRPHTLGEAEFVLEAVEAAQERFLALVGRRVVYAADEYYLLTGRAFPPLSAYEEPSQIENGIGMAAAFADSFHGGDLDAAPRSGFFQAVDGAPASGYRALRTPGGPPEARRGDPGAPVVVLSGEYGARIVAPLVASAGRSDVTVRAIENRYFGGNISVTGLLCGEDVTAALDGIGDRARVVLPDVCLNEGRFLDGVELAALGGRVEILETTGRALAEALGVGSGAAPGRTVGVAR